MRHFTDSDVEGGKIYDSKLFKRMIRYAYPHKHLFIITAVLLLFTTVFQVITPYITKTAIDRHIVPGYVKVDLTKAGDVKVSGIPIKGNVLLIDVNETPKHVVEVLQARGAIMPGRYVLVDPNVGRAGEVIAAHPEIFEKIPEKELYIFPVNKTSLLSRSEITALRGRDIRGVIKYALIFMVILILNMVFSAIQTYALSYAGQKIMYDMRKEVFGHILKLPVPFFDRNPVGRIVTRVTNDILAINQMYTDVLIYLFRDVLMAVGIFIIMVKMNIRLSFLILLLVPLLVALTAWFQKAARKQFRKVRKAIARINAFIQEHLGGIEIVRLLGAEDVVTKKFDRVNKEYYDATIGLIYIFGTFRPAVELLRSMGLALIIWYGGGQVIREALSFGALVAFISYVRMFFQPIIELADKFNIMQGAMAAAERIFGILDTPAEKYDGKTLSDVKGHVKFEDVWFAYNDEEWVLKGVSFEVKPGQTFAIVGPTGAGKTSIISILLRFYEIQKGSIKIDGVDIRELDLRFLRRQIALVLQDVFIFSGTVRDNIRLHSGEIGDKEVLEAARYVYAHEFIKKLPDGYDSELGERGLNVSVGQRQLISFARAVAFNPKILILDEATSSVDSETEHLIQEAIKKLLKGRTSIVIAHRLSTIRDADQIIVLSNGRIIEQGTHRELMERKGFYYYLYTIQLGMNKAS